MDNFGVRDPSASCCCLGNCRAPLVRPASEASGARRIDGPTGCHFNPYCSPRRPCRQLSRASSLKGLSSDLSTCG
jgi:hypothetical protein